MHLIGVDQTLAGHHIEIHGIEGRDQPVGPAALQVLAAAGAGIHGPRQFLIALAAPEPLRLGLGVGERPEDLRRRGLERPLDAEHAVHHRARGGRCIGHAGYLHLQPVQRLGPALLGAAREVAGGGVQQRVVLFDIELRAAADVVERHRGQGVEQRGAVAAHHGHVDHQPRVRQDFDKMAAHPVRLPVRRAHAVVEPAAHAGLDLGLGNREPLRAEPVLDVLGRRPRLEHEFLRGVERARDRQRARLRQLRQLRQWACRIFSCRRHWGLPPSSWFPGSRPGGRSGLPTRPAGR
ncbi:hypothetical protein D3C72_850730 [compost metagenome]